MNWPRPRWRWVRPLSCDDGGTVGLAHAVDTEQELELEPPARSACGLETDGWPAADGAGEDGRCSVCWREAFDVSLASLGPEGIALAYHHAVGEGGLRGSPWSVTRSA